MHHLISGIKIEKFEFAYVLWVFVVSRQLESQFDSPSFLLMSKGGKGKLTSETSGQLFYYADDTDIGELSQSLDRIEMLEDKVKSIRNQINVKLAEQQSAKIAEKAIPEDTPSDLSLSQSESAKLEPDQKRGSLDYK